MGTVKRVAGTSRPRRRPSRASRLAAAAALAAAGALIVPGAARAAFTPGTAGVGDPFFPNAGNGGYEVADYALKLRYRPSARKLEGKARITANATQDLTAQKVERVAAAATDAARAEAERHGGEEAGSSAPARVAKPAGRAPGRD